MKRRKLPAGIQTFRRIREEDCYYVDKTACVCEMAAEGAHYFRISSNACGQGRREFDASAAQEQHRDAGAVLRTVGRRAFCVVVDGRAAPSRPGRKAHDCCLSGGTDGVSPEGPERNEGRA